MIRSGARIPTAIKEVLGMTITDFAAKYNLHRATVTMHINGTTRPTDATLDALVAEIGGTREEWAQLLWQAAKPTTVEAA